MKDTIVDVLKPDSTGVMGVRIRLFNKDGSWAYHRTTIPPGIDAAAQMAMVNSNILRRNAKAVAHRATYGKGVYFDHMEEHLQLSGAEIAKVVAACAQIHTPEVIAVYKKRQEESRVRA